LGIHRKKKITQDNKKKRNRDEMRKSIRNKKTVLAFSEKREAALDAVVGEEGSAASMGQSRGKGPKKKPSPRCPKKGKLWLARLEKVRRSRERGRLGIERDESGLWKGGKKGSLLKDFRCKRGEEIRGGDK